MVDMINVRSAQTVFAIGENGAISVGINYMISGVGTVVQPIVVRRFVAQTPRNVQVCTAARSASQAAAGHIADDRSRGCGALPQALLLSALLQLALGALALYFSRQYHWFLIANLLRSGATSIGQVLVLCTQAFKSLTAHSHWYAHRVGRVADLLVAGAAASGARPAARPGLCVRADHHHRVQRRVPGTERARTLRRRRRS